MFKGSKFIIVAFCLLSSVSLKAQIFYSGANSKEMESLRKGVYFIKTGYDKIDSAIIFSLKNSWEFSKYNILEKNKSNNLSKNDIVLRVGNDLFKGSTLSLLSYKHFKNSYVRENKTIVTMYTNGFDYGKDSESLIQYCSYMIKAMNSGLQSIVKSAIDGKSINNKLRDAVIPNGRELNSINLIVLSPKKRNIDLDLLSSYGIKYSIMSPAEFFKLPADDMGEYCLFYYSTNTYPSTSIIDLVNNKLLYTYWAFNPSMEFGYQNLFGKGQINQLTKFYKYNGNSK